MPTVWLNMERLSEAARRTGFSEDTVQKIIDMNMEENDLRRLTRADINSEFNGLKFAERKKLWCFFEEQKQFIRTPAAQPQQQDDPEPPRDDNPEVDDHIQTSQPDSPPAGPHPDVPPPPYSSVTDSFDDQPMISMNGAVGVAIGVGSQVANNTFN